MLPGADAEQMERLVAIPIEDAINGIEDIREIQSASRAGLAVINVEFEWGADPEEKFGEVVREINVVRPEPAGRHRRYPHRAATIRRRPASCRWR